MNTLLLTSGFLALLLGIVHSVLGEKLIFKRLRTIDLTLSSGDQAISPRHLNTLWSTWHLVTLFGFGLGATLLVLSSIPSDPIDLVSKAISITFLVSTVFWVVGTKGKHPAWLIFLVIAVLSWFANA